MTSASTAASSTEETGSNLLTPERIAELEAFDGGGQRVLSVYLDFDPQRQVRHAYRAELENLAKEIRPSLGRKERDVFQAEVAVVLDWLDGNPPRGKGLALFSSSSRKFFEAHWLPVRVRDHLTWELKPDVAPLLEVADEYERYAVALVETNRARLFTVFMGAIEESDALRDKEVPPRHDQGGVSQSHFQHHHDLHVLWHLKRVAERLAALFRRRPFDRLILAGPEEVTSEFRSLLPDPLARRVAAVVPLETYANDREILEKTLEVEARVEREAEERLLQELFEIAGAGGRATAGIGQTLEALWLGEVRTLVVADGPDLEGSECSTCGRLEPGTLATCPACGNPMRPVHNVVHRAMARTIEQAGRVEVVHGEAARRLQEAGGGLGALLRFRATAAPIIA
ncbi:MAG: peptide chain release factor subunit 1 [Gemmatimonadales bacterium]|nr:peptide chain release factor subunit 1 [Gemmatimonadales bacterium]